jgi:site-specific DNA recombinase
VEKASQKEVNFHGHYTCAGKYNLIHCPHDRTIHEIFHLRPQIHEGGGKADAVHPKPARALEKLAKQQNLAVAGIIREKESAHAPGRPLFNAMMKRIEAGEASGIIAWHPDRLARNSRDGGEIIYFLDEGFLADLKFATFWFENTPQGKSNLGHEFVQTKQYSDKLGCDTQRGLENKAKMGYFPGLAPVGYLNDKGTKTIVLDPHTAPLVVEAFKAYAEGDKTLEQIQEFFATHGILTKKRNRNDTGGKTLGVERVRRILRNPFYYGHFRYAGELYEGKHKPIISKELFDKVQSTIAKRTHHIPEERIPKPFLGLFKCGKCGMAITAELQKGHTYYRCTKKSKTRKCSQRHFTREEELDRQLSTLLAPFSLRNDWADEMLGMAENERESADQASAAFVQEAQLEMANVKTRLNRLVSIYVSQDIDRDAFIAQKETLLAKKKQLQENIKKNENGQMPWLEPFTEWVKTAKTAGEIAMKGSPQEKKVLARKVFGSNLVLDCKKARGSCVKPWSLLVENTSPGGLVPEEGIEPPTKGL